MLHKLLSVLDSNSKSATSLVFLNIVDWNIIHWVKGLKGMIKGETSKPKSDFAVHAHRLNEHIVYNSFIILDQQPIFQKSSLHLF